MPSVERRETPFTPLILKEAMILCSYCSSAEPMSMPRVESTATASRPLILTNTKISWKYCYSTVPIYPVRVPPFPKSLVFS